MSTGPGFDVIVVGSGFGGAVNGARLAEAGLRVLMLERGPWWGPEQRTRPDADRRDYPRGPFGSRKFLRGLRWARHGRRFERVLQVDGFLEMHRFDRLMTVTSSGVGGGSHHYTSIMAEPPAEFFDAYPPEITGLELHPCFERVRATLRPSPLPQRPEKDRVFAGAVAAAGLPATQSPDLAVAWATDPRRPTAVENAAGVRQRTSTYRGWVFTGCDDGSNTSLDLTYVPLALRHGAQLRPLCEVVAIRRDESGYLVRYLDHRTGREAIERAPRLILAAGCLNTLRLLFAARDRDHTLPQLSAMLGRRFSINGDRLSLVWRSRVLRDSSWGPSFSAVCHVERDGRHSYDLGAVGLPVQTFPLPSALTGPLKHSTFLFSMGRDSSTGEIAFDGIGLTTRLSRSNSADLFDRTEDAMARVARHYEARHVLPSRREGRDGLFAVHPMGGCAMAGSADAGVTDHKGEVFGHPGLFVADGSLYPRSPGVAPSMTIAALAERQAQLISG